MLIPSFHSVLTRWGPVALLGLALPACAPPAPPRLVCALGPATLAPNAAGDLLFALTSAVIDPSDSLDVSHTGFDLDGLVSTDSDPGGCTHPDYRSSLDSDQDCAHVLHEHCVDSRSICSCVPRDADAGTCLGAVDNQFMTGANLIQTALNLDIRAAAHRAMTQGRFVVLVQLTGVDDLTDDATIGVRLFRGFAAPGTACETPSARATYQIDRASLRAGGSTPSDAAVVLAGSIINRRVRVATDDRSLFPLRWPSGFPTAAAPLPLDTHRATLAMDLAGDVATRGNFGGWVDTDPILAWVDPDYRNVVRGVLGGIVDIAVNGICDGSTSTPATFGGISIGFGFDAVRVQLDPISPVVDGAQPGSCESTLAPGDAGHD